MAHSRIKPAGWSTAEKLTSAQQSQLDINISESLDKTTAGDTIAGTVNFSGAGNVAANIAASVKSTTAGGFQHAGGSSDWTTFSANRSVTRIESPVRSYKQSNMSANTVGHFVATAANGSWQMHFDYVHDGSTISSIVFYFKIATGHGGLPAVFPKVSVARVDLTVGTGGVTLNSTDAGGGLAVSAAGSVVAYEAGGAIQSFTYTCDQNNVVDRSKYVYLVTLVADENGANSQGGNSWVGAQAVNGSIGSMKFG